MLFLIQTYLYNLSLISIEYFIVGLYLLIDSLKECCNID
jgi:hypothetical protein